MGCYKVRFDDYCLAHYDNFTYFNYFEVGGNKYPIGTYVKLTKSGEYRIFKGYNHSFIRGNFRLVDHFISNKNIEYWIYIIGKSYESNMYYFHTTRIPPDELIETVLYCPIDKTTFIPGKLQVDFGDPTYLPKDWEVEGVMIGWAVMAMVWIGAWVFKDWWITLIVQIVSGFYFGSWREQKINDAISKQKFCR